MLHKKVSFVWLALYVHIKELKHAVEKKKKIQIYVAYKSDLYFPVNINVQNAAKAGTLYGPNWDVQTQGAFKVMHPY